MSGVESWLVVIILGGLLFMASIGIDALLERAQIRSRRNHNGCPTCDGEGWE